MAPLPHDQKFIDDFLAYVETLRQAYQHSSFSYVALRSESGFAIVQARLFLNVVPAGVAPAPFESTNVRVGLYQLSELKTDARGLINDFAAGRVVTPQGVFQFSSADSGRYGATFLPLFAEGLRTQRRISVLRLAGAQMMHIPQPELDWEIKGASTPYDGLQDLLHEFGLEGTLSLTSRTFEVFALSVAAIDVTKSVVHGEIATIHVVLADGLERGKTQLGYRVLSGGRVVTRSAIGGDKLEWSKDGATHAGRTTVPVPKGAVINAVVSYSGTAQHHWWLFDPTAFQNARRAVYEAFDPGLAILRDIIAAARGKGPEARDFESAVAWLLWMLGFGVAQVGGTRRTSEAADLIATSPSGHYAVIECTTGLLKGDNKLGILYGRTEAVRRSLVASNQAHCRVIPVIVTSQPRDVVKADLEQAERLGMLVITRENLEETFNRTLVQANADRIYEEAEQAIRDARSKYDAQPSLPFNVRDGIA